MKFKIGDKVRSNVPARVSLLSVNVVYTVTRVNPSGFLELSNLSGQWNPAAFRKVTKLEKVLK